VATYENGVLSAIEGIAKIGILWESIPINAPIPFQEVEVEAMAKLYDYAVTCTKLVTDGAGEKVRAFCAAYKSHLHISYTVLKSDARKLEGLTVDELLLKTYFTNKEWWGKQPKSITNYASNYNNLRQLLVRPAAAEKSKYPTEPDMELFKKLDPVEGMKAAQHWYKLGHRPIKSSTGDIIGWNLAKAATVLLFIVLALGCGLFRRSAQPAQTAAVTAIQSDTVKVEPDTLQGLVDPEKLEESGVWSWENDRTSVEMVLVDSSKYDSLEAAGWTWLDSGTALDGAPTAAKKRPEKAVLVRVITKPVEVVEQDTTCVDVPAPAPVYPYIPQEGQVNIWWLVSAALALVAGLVFFIKNRKKDGKDNAEA
jgi:hypothetical protein